MSRRKSLFNPDDDNYSMVAAIEIGTSYSGFAYATRRDSRPIGQHIVMNPVWLSPDKSMTTLRTPTCLLLNEKKDFEAFGYEAEKQYLSLVKENKQNKMFYFRRFKTKLFGNNELRGSTLIKDESGKEFPALKVFSYTIRYLKSQVLNDICLRGHDVEADDIKWVLTVPACWTDLAKQFMRKAAEMAGIARDQLKLALEPEAASIFLQNIPSNMVSEKLPILKSGTKYAIADLGGGITDIVLHEKRKEGLREISRGFGSKLGGGAVDNIFFQFLNKLFGETIVQEFVTKYKKDFLLMMREFEQVKKLVTPFAKTYVELKVPACIEVLCQKQQYNDTVENLIFRSVYKGRVRLLNHKLRIDAVVCNEFFRATAIEMAKVITHSLTAVSTAKDVSVLVVVGAFSESPVVQDILHQELLGKTKIKQIIVPPEADIAVLKGAVIFGNNTSSVLCRVNKYTVGLRIARLFNPELHSPKKRVVLTGCEYVLDIFSPFLTIGTRVPVGFISHQALTSTEPLQKKIEVDVYFSNELSHNFVTDEGCSRLGHMHYFIPSPSEEARTIYVDFILGDTELYLYVIDKKTMNKTKYPFPSIPEK